MEGEDGSLPLWVKPAAYSGIQINPKLVSAEFPGRIQRAIHASWPEIEPTEGTFEFRGLREEIQKASEGGRYAIKMGLERPSGRRATSRACKIQPSGRRLAARPRFGLSPTAFR